MRKRVAINGFGRIGRVLTRLLLANDSIELVAVNDIHSIESLAHLLKYDSTHGTYDEDIAIENEKLKVGEKFIQFYSESDPEELPWEELNIDVVVEATGIFKTRQLAGKHLKAGAKKVIISAPSDDDSIDTVVLGVNSDNIGSDAIYSCASCTTNNAAPMIAILNDLCNIESCYITTIHSYTGDQKLLDASHRDLRRARTATKSIIPTTTGAAKALTKVFPKIKDVIGGCGIRVPVIDGSLTDITCIVENPISAEKINEAFKESAAGEYHGILEYSDEPLVSTDIIGNSHSCVFDSGLTSVIGKMVKIVGWYDNEMGYSNRLVEMIGRL